MFLLLLHVGATLATAAILESSVGVTAWVDTQISNTTGVNETVCTEPLGIYHRQGKRIISNPDELGEMTIISYPCNRKSMLEDVMINNSANFELTVGEEFKFLCESFKKARCAHSETDMLRKANFNYEKVKTVINRTHTEFTIKFLESTKPGDDYWLGCQCNRTNGLTITYGQMRTLIVDYKPPPIKGFKCVIEDYAAADCTWDSQMKFGVGYTVCFGLVKRPLSFRNCTYEGKANSFQLVDRTSMLLYEEYRFEIIATNKYGTRTTIFDYKITTVKLSAPKMELILPQSVGSREVQFNYIPGCFDRTVYRVMCTTNGILYQANLTVVEEETSDFKDIFEADRQISVNGTLVLKVLFKEEGLKVPLKVDNLLPYTTYQLSMVHKPNANSSLWSQPTIKTFRTTATAPFRGPFMNENGFAVTGICEGQRRISIYWKRLGAYNGGNGEIMEYGVEGTTTKTSAEYREIITCVPEEEAVIFIYASNVAGRSSNLSQIVIPASSQMLKDPIQPCHIMVWERTETNSVLIDWLAADKHLLQISKSERSYTLFWCLRENGTSFCQEEFDWIKIEDSAATKHVLQFESDVSLYRFGLAVKQDSISSGIIWVDCKYSSTIPGEKDVRFTVSKGNSSQAKVAITPRCHAIRDININYCIREISSTRKKCAGKEQTIKNVTARCPKTTFFPAEENKEYLVWLTVFYADGLNTAVNSTTPQMLDMSLDSKAGDKRVLGIALGAVFTLLVTVAITIALFYIYRKRRKAVKTLYATTVYPVDEDQFQTHSETSSVTSDYDSHSINILGYKVKDSPAADVPLLQSAQESQAPDTCRYVSTFKKPSDKFLLKQQTSIDSRRSAADSELSNGTFQSRPSLQHTTDSAYCPSTDNSGGDLGYQMIVQICSQELSDGIDEEQISNMSYPEFPADIGNNNNQDRCPPLHIDMDTIDPDTNLPSSTYENQIQQKTLTPSICSSRPTPSADSNYLRVDHIDEDDFNDEYIKVNGIKSASIDSGSFLESDDDQLGPSKGMELHLMDGRDTSGAYTIDWDPTSGSTGHMIALDEFLT